MKCSFFRKHLREYMNDELFLQMKETMDEHLQSCNSCRDLYDSELQLDEMLFKALKHEDVKFNSSRNAILNSIDKRKYSKGYLSKVKYSLAKNRLRIGSALTAAMLLFVILTSQGVIGVNKQGINQAASNLPEIQQNKDTILEDKEYTVNDTHKEGATSENLRVDYAMFLESIDVMFSTYAQKENPEFIITDRSPEQEYGYTSSWKNSPSNNFSALLDGKGEMDSIEEDTIGGMDEGIATLVVRDNSLDQYKNFQIVNYGDNQLTPKYIEWIDDSNLLVTIGMGYGMVALGGPLYLLNTNTGKTMLLYEPDNPSKEFVTSTVMQENQLKLKVAVYTDDIYNKFRIEERYINFNDISLQEEPSGVIREYQDFIRSKDYEGFDRLLSDEYEPLAEKALGSVKAIEGLTVKKVIKVDNYVEDDQLKEYGFEDMTTYCIAADYSLGNDYSGALSEGINYQYMILVKGIGSQEWRIAYVYTVV